jgi:NifU-like protein involved in Fe-S cluster formation
MRILNSVIADHLRKPRNYGLLPDAQVTVQVCSSVCGDEIVLSANLMHDLVVDVGVETCGCSPVVAVASILSEEIRSRTIGEVALIDESVLVNAIGRLQPQQRHAITLGLELLSRFVAAALSKGPS